MRGRKAALEHLCDKKNFDKLGKWRVKEGQNIVLKKPKDRDTWMNIMSQRVLVECIPCGAVKHCCLEKLNEKHFDGTLYLVPQNFWSKEIGVLEALSEESSQKKEERERRLEKVSSSLASKAAAMRKAISEPVSKESLSASSQVEVKVENI